MNTSLLKASLLLISVLSLASSPAYSVSTTGVQGPQGPVGPAGPKGPTGPKGERGIQGAQGIQGKEGPIGKKGATGPRGDKGPAGASQGLQGIQGPKGDKGDVGAQGIQGLKGDTGARGPQGSPGNVSSPCEQADLLGTWTVIVNNTKAGDIEICTLNIDNKGNLNNTVCTLIPSLAQGTGSGTGIIDNTCVATFVLNMSSGENIQASARLSSVSKDILTGIYNSNFSYYGTFNATKHPATPTNTTVYHIGDTGPAGGKVFYLTDNTGLHGLEAAPVDQSAGATWGCPGTSISGAQGTAIGTGAANTAAIVNGCNEANTAAKIADAYTLNGYSDWFLPSKDELNLLYLQKNVVGGFASNSYWSSSENPSYYAWYQGFGGGNQSSYYKTNTFPVRAVRAF